MYSTIFEIEGENAILKTKALKALDFRQSFSRLRKDCATMQSSCVSDFFPETEYILVYWETGEIEIFRGLVTKLLSGVEVFNYMSRFWAGPLICYQVAPSSTVTSRTVRPHVHLGGQVLVKCLPFDALVIFSQRMLNPAPFSNNEMFTCLLFGSNKMEMKVFVDH